MAGRNLMFLSMLIASITTGCATTAGTVRDRAVYDLACDSSEVDVENVNGDTYRATGCGRTNDYTCETQYATSHGVVIPVASTCTSDNADPRPIGGAAPAPAPAVAVPVASLHEPPTGAGGFGFRASEDDVHAACDKAGHAFASTASEQATCDGLAQGIGAPAQAQLTFCPDGLCSVAIDADLATPGADMARALTQWKAQLTQRYGAPTSTTANVPSRCDKDVGPCLVDGSATLSFAWSWPHERIDLAPDVTSGAPPRVRIAYATTETAPASAPGL